MVLEGILLGMGNPLLDVSAVVEDDFLNRWEWKSCKWNETPLHHLLISDLHWVELSLYPLPSLPHRNGFQPIYSYFSDFRWHRSVFFFFFSNGFDGCMYCPVIVIGLIGRQTIYYWRNEMKDICFFFPVWYLVNCKILLLLFFLLLLLWLESLSLLFFFPLIFMIC